MIGMTGACELASRHGRTAFQLRPYPSSDFAWMLSRPESLPRSRTKQTSLLNRLKVVENVQLGCIQLDSVSSVFSLSLKELSNPQGSSPFVGTKMFSALSLPAHLRRSVNQLQRELNLSRRSSRFADDPKPAATQNVRRQTEIHQVE